MRTELGEQRSTRVDRHRPTTGCLAIARADSIGDQDGNAVLSGGLLERRLRLVDAVRRLRDAGEV